MRRSAVLALLLPRLLLAQQPVTVAIKPADAVLKERLALISTIRELSDGRVIFTNGRDNLIVVADFKSGKVERIGQAPGSSGDFVNAGLMGALAGDTSYIVDRVTKGWTVFDGTRVLGVLPATSPLVAAIRSPLYGTDISGHILTSMPSHLLPAEPLHTTDSMYLVRVDHATGEQDTVAHIALSSGPGKTIHKGDTVDVFSDQYEMAVMARDGWVAIVRIKPYRVDWWSPSGGLIRGAPIAYQPITLDDKERAPFLYRVAKDRFPADWPTPVARWPAVMPPFDGYGQPIATPDGKILVSRTHAAADSGRHYDIVDRKGSVVGQLVVRDPLRILGFGAHSVYIGVASDDNSTTIERHPWP